MYSVLFFSTYNKELTPICISSSICHRQCARASVLELEVLVREAASVDRFASCAIMVCEVATLDPGENKYLYGGVRKKKYSHETLNDTVERAAFVAEAFFSCSELTEVLCSLGNDLAIQAHDNSSAWLSAMLNVKEDLQESV